MKTMRELHEPFLSGWLKNNIFNSKTGDAIAYFFFYMLIPVFVTVISLNILSTDIIETAYFYITILISALNCIYDATNRKTDKKSVRNLKLLLMNASSVIVSCYCMFEILYLLIAKTCMRFDYWLIAYFVVIIIGGTDIIYCITNNVSIYEFLDDSANSQVDANINQTSEKA